MINEKLKALVFKYLDEELKIEKTVILDDLIETFGLSKKETLQIFCAYINSDIHKGGMLLEIEANEVTLAGVLAIEENISNFSYHPLKTDLNLLAD